MIPGLNSSMLGSAAIPVNLAGIIAALGLEENNKLILDAGDAASWAGSGLWNDLSGNGHHFRFGDNSTADSADPSPAGTPGGLSANEYFLFDGGDHFTADAGNAAWMDNLHKNNALFTMVAWARLANGSYNTLAGTSYDISANTGFSWAGSSASDNPRLIVLSNGVDLNVTSSLNSIYDQWAMYSVSYNEATGSLLFGINDSFDAKTGQTYSGPSSGGASRTFAIGSTGYGGGASRMLRNGSRLSSFAAWEGEALTSGEIAALYEITKGRFGL